MHVYKISNNLYRIYNGKIVKDILLKNGRLLKPENKQNILTEEEKDFVMDKIINE